MEGDRYVHLIIGVLLVLVIQHSRGQVVVEYGICNGICCVFSLRRGF